MFKILTPDDYTVMPWKNGRGTTTEITRWPAHSSDQSFLWRISIATINASGPFSAYPNHERVIVLLKGESIFLKHDDGTDPVELKPLVPHQFHGKISTFCDAGGPGLDFNVMTHEIGIQSEVKTYSLAQGKSVSLTNSSPRLFIFCHSGTLRLKSQSIDVELKAGETFDEEMLQGDRNIEVSALSLDSNFIVVGISRKADASEFYAPAIEDFLPSPAKRRSLLQMLPQRGAFLNPLMIGILMILILTSQPIENFSVTRAAIIGRHEYWRLFTALLGHADFLHLAHNLPPFLLFGWLLRAYFGIFIFPYVALIAGMLSNYITIFYYPNTTQLIGASGMIYSMIAMWLVFYVRFDHEPRLNMKILRALAFALVLLMPKTYDPKVSYLAHASGFGVGIILALLCLPLMHRSREHS